MPTAWPTLSRIPSRQSLMLTYNTQVHVSPFDGSVQTQPVPGAKWGTTIEYDNLLPADALKLQAFLASLGGRAGRVLVGNFGQPYPSGTIAGTPLVNGAGFVAGNSSVNTDGWGAGGSLKAGDFFGLSGRLYQVNEDASASAGAMTITFSPPLRAAVLDNSALTFSAPTTTMMLVDDMQGWSYTAGLFRSFAIDLVEVL
jgi:hypothetical protein